MDKHSFFTMDTATRAKKINQMLHDHEFQEVAKAIGLPTSTFSKEMARDDYIFIKRENKYFKFLRDTSVESPHKSDDLTVDYEKELTFLKHNLEVLKSLISSNESSENLILDKVIYDNEAKFVNKNMKLNQSVYVRFTELCERKFPHLKVQDLYSQALVDFINKNDGNTSLH